MFAVIKTGGKQYTVRAGDVLRVEKLACEAGETIQFNDVLVMGDSIGAPFVAGAAVTATVIDQVKADKVIHFTRRRRKHSSKRTVGHRQPLTLVRIGDLLSSGADTTGHRAASGRAMPTASAPAVATPAPSRSRAKAAAPAPLAEAVAAEPAEAAAKPKRSRAKAAAEAPAETEDKGLLGSVLSAAASAAGSALAAAATTATNVVATAAEAATDALTSSRDKSDDAATGATTETKE